MGILIMGIISQSSGDESGKNALPIEFSGSNNWDVSADEPWWALVDIRNMLNIFHPFVVSQNGKSAGASREITISDDWKPPFALKFFCADDYFADAENHKPGQLGTESFFDHRFKQVLIDDQVVWERDVCDKNTQGSQNYFQVDITDYVKPGGKYKMVFRVLDKTSTLERNERDVWFIGGVWYAAGDGKTEEPPRFHTAVWFADPIIGEKDAVESFPVGKRPHEITVEKIHSERKPLTPRGNMMPSPTKLKLVTPVAIPEDGFPMTCGIPMPPGALKDTNSVYILDSNNNKIPIQTKTTGFWQDGSVRWLLLDAIVPPNAKDGDEFFLHFGESVDSPESQMEIKQDGKSIILNTGKLNIKLGLNPDILIDEISMSGNSKPLMADIKPKMSVILSDKSSAVEFICEQMEIKECGLVSICVEIHGSMAAKEQHIGRFIFRLSAYSGSSTIKTHFKIINDVKPEPYTGTIDDPPLNVSELSLVASTPDSSEAQVGIMNENPALSESGSISALQEDADHLSINSVKTEDKKAQGWMSVMGEEGSVQISVWKFWQQCPKSFELDQNEFEIGLFARSEAIPLYKPRFGEAKRHDINFTFSDKPISNESNLALGLLADQPPRLFDREWFCMSGGLGLMKPNFYDQETKLAKYTVGAYGDVSSKMITGQFGIRNFGDMPYSKEQWRNGYWAIVQGTLNWGVNSDDQRWIERSFETARHIADVDTVNIPPKHEDWENWNGVICALGYDHSVHGGHALWPAFQVGESLILHYWMTGDPDSLDSALANADYLMRSGSGLGSSEARSQARPMLTLLRAWQTTGDEKYREAASLYIDLKFQTEKVIDWRRGTYIQPTYNNWRCVSAGLDSMYAINIYEYYRLTGDVDAAQLVVAIADSVYAESMLPQEEGIGSFIFYVRYSRNSWYYTQMAILFYMAYDLTDDIRFLRAGRASFERYRLCENENGDPMYQPYHNFGWLDPEFGGWQMEFRDIPTKPFHITEQTPDPDPAAFR